MTVSASIVVDFVASSANTMLIAELDEIKNNDKTSFLTTETAFFSIYQHPTSLSVDKPVPTSGMVINVGSVTRTKTQVLQFVGTQSLALAYPPSGPVSINRWYGNVGQDFTISGFTASISSDAPCICEVTYNTVGELWELIPPSINLDATPEWPITIYITGGE